MKHFTQNQIISYLYQIIGCTLIDYIISKQHFYFILLFTFLLWLLRHWSQSEKLESGLSSSSNRFRWNIFYTQMKDNIPIWKIVEKRIKMLVCCLMQNCFQMFKTNFDAAHVELLKKWTELKIGECQFENIKGFL